MTRQWDLAKIGVLALILLCSFLGGYGRQVFGVEPADPNLCPKGRGILRYFESIYGRRILLGYNVYVHTPDDYEQTGMLAAIWGRDIQWLGPVEEVIAHAKAHGYLLTLHWHWHLGGDSAWTNQRKAPVDVGRVVTPGTAEHATAMAELARTADDAAKAAGGRQRWSCGDHFTRSMAAGSGGPDLSRPENTAELWRMMFRYFTNERQCIT